MSMLPDHCRRCGQVHPSDVLIGCPATEGAVEAAPTVRVGSAATAASDLSEVRRCTRLAGWPALTRSRTPMAEHWRQTAVLVGSGDMRILGEDYRGDLFVPSRTREGWWDRRFQPWNPSHWPYYVRSRLTNRIAFLDPSDG